MTKEKIDLDRLFEALKEALPGDTIRESEDSAYGHRADRFEYYAASVHREEDRIAVTRFDTEAYGEVFVQYAQWHLYPEGYRVAEGGLGIVGSKPVEPDHELPYWVQDALRDLGIDPEVYPLLQE